MELAQKKTINNKINTNEGNKSDNVTNSKQDQELFKSLRDIYTYVNSKTKFFNFRK